MGVGAAIDRARLLRAVDDAPLDPHATLVAKLLHCHAAAITVIDDARGEQRFLGMVGLPAGPSAERGTPLAASLGAIVANTDAPLIIADLAADPEFADHPAGAAMDVAAYAGVPLHTAGRRTVGAVSAMSASPRDWSSEDIERLTAVRDFIERDLADLIGALDDRERTEEISLLLSTLRHELGGELQIVLGGIETARLPAVSADIHDRVLDNARRDARRVVDTLDALLRVDSRAPAKLVEVDLQDLARDAITGSTVADCQHRLQVAVEPIRMTTEPTLLGRILLNLADNACKYSEGPVQIHSRSRADGWTALMVTDTGEGFPPHATRQLFEPFNRANDDDGQTGFGLGLFIVRMLTARLGATLEVDSAEGGTTVSVWLPPSEAGDA